MAAHPEYADDVVSTKKKENSLGELFFFGHVRYGTLVKTVLKVFILLRQITGCMKSNFGWNFNMTINVKEQS
jgi:hypothetical protein